MSGFIDVAILRLKTKDIKPIKLGSNERREKKKKGREAKAHLSR